MKSLARFSWANNKTRWLYPAGFLFLGLAAFLSIFLGSTSLPVSEMIAAFRDGFNVSPGTRIFAYVRLPRTLAALACGGALAVSGAVIQGVLANRLASPSIIGVNAGAGLAVTVCTALGIVGGWQLSLFSFCGAFGAVLLISLSAKRWGASRSTVILMGVAMNCLLGAISDTVTALLPDVSVMSSHFRIGEFSSVGYGQLLPAVSIILVTVLILRTMHNQLDVLTLGEKTAQGLGMNTTLVRTIFLLLAALLAGCAVSLAGLLSFVGLLIPNALRRLVGSGARQLLPLSAAAGAALVTVCDLAARLVFAPYELPVGILLSVIGGPVFLLLLLQKRGGHRDA